MKQKLIFWLLWILLLSLGPITIIRDTSWALVATHRAVLMNLIQRFLGLTAFALMFWQIMLGAYMERWTEKLGGWVLRFHIVEGVAIYTLILLHPLFFVLFNYFSGKGLDPLYVFTQVCVLCRSVQELYYTLGRISFWLVNVTVFAGLFRMATPFMRLNWRKFHVFNYISFLLIGIHGLSIGTDFMVMPFFAFAILAYLLVLYTVIRKLPNLFSFLKNWLRS